MGKEALDTASRSFSLRFSGGAFYIFCPFGWPGRLNQHLDLRLTDLASGIHALRPLFELMQHRVVKKIRGHQFEGPDSEYVPVVHLDLEFVTLPQVKLLQHQLRDGYLSLRNDLQAKEI